MFAGGIADKLGNRYEAKWLVRQLLDVIGGQAQSLRYEGISATFDGFEFAVRRGDNIEWHQTKINNQHGNWTLNALEREGVLSAFKARLNADVNSICFFVSQDPAKDIGSLAEKAKIATSVVEYQGALGEGHAEKFDELRRLWAVDACTAYSWLQRSYFKTESQSSIESIVATFADLYFFKAGDVTFETLREFVETRINRELTTENVRSELRSEGRLILKDWAIDTTLRERLSLETIAYLHTHSPFGAGKSRISRAETYKLINLVKNPTCPCVILLTGVAGSGKSGVLREFIEQLVGLGIPHLAVRIDQHLDCTSPKSLGKAVTDREESLAATLKGTAPDQLSVLIVDQVDAVSEVSGRNGAVKRTVLRLVDEVRNFGGIVLVIACRTFDLESDQRLKALKDAQRVEHIDIPLLTWESDVKPLLLSASIDVGKFSDRQREILCLPLNLAVFLEIFDGVDPLFASRNDLFTRLLEMKTRSIRADRSSTWEAIVPLSKLAEWMSEQQRLDAPEYILSEFAGALDILTSEGLIVRSRGNVSFFHESLFDYVYARTFASRRQSLVSLLLTSEQHLFRRTQVRQILETLRQIDVTRYLQELRDVISSEKVRYHIKLAVAQWLGSISDPLKEEKNIVLTLDVKNGSYSPLLRHACFSSPGWFDRLLEDGWIATNLNSSSPQRPDGIIWWLSNIAGQRPAEVATLLDNWWGGRPDRGKRLLDWFAFVKRQKPDAALVDLCCRVTQSNPPGLFEDRQSNNRVLLLHTWAATNPTGAAEILAAYFDAWFEAHPNHHPFERDEFRELDAHSLGEMAKKAPHAFIKGSISALIRSIDIITAKELGGNPDYSFRYRNYSGHHFGADAFLNMFRAAMRHIASENPEIAEGFLRKIAPNKHEVCTHIWLETIIANGEVLSRIFPDVLDSPHLFEAGWNGADWKSFADATKAVLPNLHDTATDRVNRLLSGFDPELNSASEILRRVREEGEPKSSQSHKLVIKYLSRSGYDQWCLLETIGESLLGVRLKDRLAQLRRKFKGSTVAEPHHNEAHFVQSPIKSQQVARMTNTQWLCAIKRYDNDEERYRGRTFVDGGARQLAGELQRLAKEQPARSLVLLEDIPDEANQAYVGRLLAGLAEATEIDFDSARRAVLNAHKRANRPYGCEIAQLISKQPRVATDPTIFEALVWYVECGEANDKDDIDSANTERELTTIDDLLYDASTLHIRGINGARGMAAEALGHVIWQVPEITERAWNILEQRVEKEPLLSVRCCLIQVALPLFNDDKERSASIVERLSRSPSSVASDAPSLFEKIWLSLAFPSEDLASTLRKRSVWCAGQGERLAQKYWQKKGMPNDKKWWSPLVTRQGTHLLPFLIRSVPAVGKRMLYRLILSGDQTARMIGAWHIFRRGFQEAQFAPLADEFAGDGVIYRRLLADVASHAVTIDEYRYRAEAVLRGAFDDDDKQVRSQAADVFRKIKPSEFDRYRGIAEYFIRSKAFEADSWAFFNALDEAECKVDDIVISATETLIADIKRNGNAAGRRTMNLHQLQETIKKEYASSEGDPVLRGRLLDLIDDMLIQDLYGVDAIVKAHER